MPYVKSLSECFGDSVVLGTDEEGNELPSEEWVLIDGGSNIILQGRDAIESETGILEWDTIYDTDIVKYLEDCDDEEMGILYKAYLDEEYMSDEIKDAAVESQGLRRIYGMKFYKTNAELSTSEGVVSFFWDGSEDVTEDDAREWMEEQRIDPLSIERWADEFESHFYND